MRLVGKAVCAKSAFVTLVVFTAPALRLSNALAKPAGVAYCAIEVSLPVDFPVVTFASSCNDVYLARLLPVFAHLQLLLTLT